MSRIELARIPALTFYKDSLTAARRTDPLPQLVCRGAPCKLYTPEVVRCESLGGVGTEVDWKVRCTIHQARSPLTTRNFSARQIFRSPCGLVV